MGEEKGKREREREFVERRIATRSVFLLCLDRYMCITYSVIVEVFLVEK